MKGVIYAATAVAGVLFLGALSLFASFAGGVSWRAFERPPQRLGRVPAVVGPNEPVVLTMTAADVDSVPEAMEARPRTHVSAEPEPAAALGDMEPRAPKAAAKKAAVRKPTLLQKVGLGGGRRGLQLRGGAGFDGGGSGQSGAFGGGAAEGGDSEDVSPTQGGAAPGAAPARARTMRAVTPTRGSAGPAPAAPAEEEPAADDGE